MKFITFLYGNYYKTRNGKKARFMPYAGFLHNREEIKKFIFEMNDEMGLLAQVEYERFGLTFINPGHPELDIVSEWEDKECECRVNPTMHSDIEDKIRNLDEPQKIEKIGAIIYDPRKENIKYWLCIIDKIDELIDAVNEMREK